MINQDRFEDKVFVSPDGCWLWTGAINVDGYGKFAVKRVARLAHKVSYQLYIGDVPNGMVLDHLCRKRSCVNPKHLEPVTHTENCHRGSGTLKVCEHGVGMSACKQGCHNIYRKEWVSNRKVGN